MMRKGWLLIVLFTLLLSSCSVTKNVPEGDLLLNKTKIKADIPDVSNDNLKDYLQQTPNSYLLGLTRFELGVYNMSGPDTSKWINRFLRSIGEAPVIYDSTLTNYSKDELTKVIHNMGYIDGSVKVDSTVKKRKIDLVYTVDAGMPYRIKSYKISLPDDSAMYYLQTSKSEPLPKAGELFNVDVLDKERDRVARVLRRRGYYNFQKELLYYEADSALRDHSVELTLKLQPFYLKNDSALRIIFSQKYIRDVVIFNIPESAIINEDTGMHLDTVVIDKYSIIYPDTFRAFRPKALLSKVYMVPGKRYNENHVDKTYSSLNSLSAVKYVSINFRDVGDNELECLIVVNQEMPHSFLAEIGGTNSDGDLGIGVGLGYQNNNIFKGFETFTFGINGSYEAMGSIGEIFNASEIGGSVSLKYPKILIPGNIETTRKLGGTTELSVSTDFQQRPQYKRILANAGMKYNWRIRNTWFVFDLVDISYIHLPWISQTFSEEYLTPSSSIRFSYEDHFIMRCGIGVSYSNKRNENQISDFYTVRAGVRTAGNLLNGLSMLFDQKKNDDGAYEIFNIRYSQYVKGDFDFSYNMHLTEFSRLVFHTAVGVGYPYGNATILPFEERYYSGGANSVRGWSVRTLGPGTYSNPNLKIDFMNESGDIKLDLNLEARFVVVGPFNLAAFLDAGNIWTIKNYPEQPGGFFRFNQFYKEIAMSYGFGIRLDFNFFIVRLDAGIKLYDPQYIKMSQRWRTEPTWADDVALHFAIGYPF